ncbi:hypothetical protein DSLASN_09570 [Desulfoluna limicola]|uniref:Uncharacterized protein n=1 Tax=Desulfoluna limicola TaxID=2810562 RepID=A0ABM7PDT1_9BACT|nr:hypothetical protein [Desulfoluna limicola]BCS95325.1 hypothetical protein DSLASN_09570 [Desulfoluna limicola]
MPQAHDASVNPGDYGLPSRTQLVWVEEGHLAIRVDRKSRIIMKDGRGLLEKAACIRETNSALRVSLKTSAPVCGKTRAFLEEHGVAVLPLTARGDVGG